VAEHVTKFLKARPCWVQSPKAGAPGRPAAPSAPGARVGFVTGVPMPAAPTFQHTAESLTHMACVEVPDAGPGRDVEVQDLSSANPEAA
jgi:hypothetical protein